MGGHVLDEHFLDDLGALIALPESAEISDACPVYGALHIETEDAI